MAAAWRGQRHTPGGTPGDPVAGKMPALPIVGKGPGSIKSKQSPNKPPQKRAPPRVLSPAGKSMPGGAAVGGSSHFRIFRPRNTALRRYVVQTFRAAGRTRNPSSARYRCLTPRSCVTRSTLATGLLTVPRHKAGWAALSPHADYSPAGSALGPGLGWSSPLTPPGADDQAIPSPGMAATSVSPASGRTSGRP